MPDICTSGFRVLFLKICAGILMVGVTGLRSIAELGTDSEEHAVKRLDFSPNHGYLA